MSKHTVLLIEDSMYLAESIVDVLEMHDYNVHVAKNGRDGIEYALKEHPDLILLDIRLPDISGYEVFHAIRKDSWGEKANITVLTASESLETISKNIDMPMDYILFKPKQSLTALIEHVKQRLD